MKINKIEFNEWPTKSSAFEEENNRGMEIDARLEENRSTVDSLAPNPQKFPQLGRMHNAKSKIEQKKNFYSTRRIINLSLDIRNAAVCPTVHTSYRVLAPFNISKSENILLHIY